MRGAILNIGNEVLLGHTINTNLSTIAKKVYDYGILIEEQRTVEDKEESIIKAIKELTATYDIVFTSGGLGPTDDDLTSQTVGKAFSKEMVFHQDILENIENYFLATGRNMPENNTKQAYFPKDSQILVNRLGTANGFYLKENNKIIVVCPGPPRELTCVLDDFLKLQILKDKLLIQTINTYGLGESHLENRLRKLDLSKKLNINTYFSFGGVEIKVVSEDEDQEIFIEAIEEIKDEFKDNVYDIDSTSMSASLLNKLLEKNKKVAFAESCTGGRLSSEFTKNPGASNSLICSLVTYTEEAKIKELGVKEETLEKFTAVSKETALEMLEGLKNKYKADFYAVTTGYASPTGNKETEGLVFIGLYNREKDETIIIKENYFGSRTQIIERVTANVYFNLMKLLK